MIRYRNHAFVIASVVFGFLATETAHAASVQQVNRSTWGANGVPNYVTMYIYVPDTPAAKPPVVVACHSCGTPVSGYFNSIQGIKAAADENGFIIILPEATGQNCWDVGTQKSLTHDGGGDTQAIAQMVKYVLTQYNGDASRVYAMGGSSGAMMTQALLAVYPDIFKAGSARAGVPAGCWADGYAASNQWSNECAGGRTTKSAMQWGDQVRAMYPGFTGQRPRVQLFHGTADQTISYNNMGEAIKEWTNVLGLPTMPTSTDTKSTPVSNYDRQFWKNECGFTRLETWAGKNGGHSMAYEEDAILAFFGLDKAGGADPETPCTGQGGAGGTGGGGAGGSGGAGAGGSTAGGAGPVGGSGGALVSGGTAGSGGSSAGSPAAGGQPATPGSAGAPTTTAGSGPVGVAGTSSSGAGNVGVGGSAAAGAPGTPAAAGTTSGGAEPEDGGCAVGGAPSKPAYAWAAAMGLGLLGLRRRKRNRDRDHT